MILLLFVIASSLFSIVFGAIAVAFGVRRLRRPEAPEKLPVMLFYVGISLMLICGIIVFFYGHY